MAAESRVESGVPGWVQPVLGMAGATGYVPPAIPLHVDLRLDSNEGAMPPTALLMDIAAEGVGLLRKYPNRSRLEALLADRLGVTPQQVFVTAGGDESLDRITRAVLCQGREIIVPAPTFEMIDIYARLTRATMRTVPWTSGPFPTEAVIAEVRPETAAIAVVSPNNPTGAVATAEDLRRLSASAPSALLIVDLAYGEFADEDLTAVALSLPNAVVVRTLSKAWGLAGLRVGYATGPAEIIGWMRASGGPYSVSGLSLAVAERWLAGGEKALQTFVDLVREERTKLAGLLARLGAVPLPSQANFVLATFDDPAWTRDALLSLGIAVRLFHNRPELERHLRITCPGHQAGFSRLAHALETALSPQAILFDLDGVVADVSKSYRRAIVETAACFGVRIEPERIAAAKRNGNANNDWELTRRLLAEDGRHVALDEVTRRFEAIYQGEETDPGLRRFESLLVDRDFLERLKKRLRLAVVTGRPRSDCDRFLREKGVADLFETCVCLEDAPPKPDPAPVRVALSRMGIERAWMIGDTPDDIRAARSAGVIPLGIAPPCDDPAETQAGLREAGAARVLCEVHELMELLR